MLETRASSCAPWQCAAPVAEAYIDDVLSTDPLLLVKR